jgi:hypothetical protein
MARKAVDVAVVIPDAGPVLTLGRIGRIDLLGTFSVPVQIVDQVHYEITKPENDPKGDVAAGLKRLHNHLQIIETNVGVGFRCARQTGARKDRTPCRHGMTEHYQHELVDIMHFNGKLMPGHQPMRVSPETRALVRSVFRQPAE